LSRMIHFYPLNPRMCQLGVRNVGYKPAPTPLIMYINQHGRSPEKNVYFDLPWGGGGFLRLFV
ncbi:hypothetical protein QUB10_09630, partial [Microcoleus sp. B5-D4]|uniref:hypothetical protein n=1 Tax=unclassified Microcoleus TaxID=2642155 RepID=UPI002FCEC472